MSDFDIRLYERVFPVQFPGQFAAQAAADSADRAEAERVLAETARTGAEAALAGATDKLAEVEAAGTAATAAIATARTGALADVAAAGAQQVGAVNAVGASNLLQLQTTASQGAIAVGLAGFLIPEVVTLRQRLADFMRGASPAVCLAARVRKHGWELEIDVLEANANGTFDITRMLLDVFDWGFDANLQLVVRNRKLRCTRARRLPHPNQAQPFRTTLSGITTWRLSLDQPVFAKAKRNAVGETGNTGIDPVLRLDAGWYTVSAVAAGAQDGIYVTNNSEEAYPLDPVRSLLPPSRLLGASARFEVGGNGLDPQQSRPWAAVRFDLTGLSSGVTRTQIVSVMTKSTAYPQRTNAAPCFAAVFDTTPFTQGAEVELRMRTYPWIGDTPTDSQGGGIYDFANEVHTVNHAGTFPIVRAFVDASAGNDATGAATTGSEATAMATPFLTSRAALRAAWIVNRSLGRNNQSGIEIIFKDGQRHRLSLAKAVTGDGLANLAFFDANEIAKAGTWCVYRPETGATNCIIERNTAITLGATLPRRTVLRGFTGIDLLGEVGTGPRAFLDGGEVTGSTYGQEVWIDNSPFIDAASTASTVIGMFQCGRVWMTNCNQPALGATPFASGVVPNEFMLVRDTDFADLRQWVGARATAGVSIRSLGGTSLAMVEPAQNVVNLGKPAQDNLVFSGFSLRSNNSSNIVFRFGSQRTITRLGVMNALFEAFGAANLGNVDIGGLGNIRISNYFWDYVTILGGPTRIGYEDTYTMTDDGDPEQQLKEWLLLRRSIVHEVDLKGDLFQGNGARIHTMNVLHWVGSKYVDILRPASGGNTAPGNGSWMGEAWPNTFRYLGPDARSQFVSYAAAFTSAGVNGVGNGDYTPAAGSQFLNRIPAGEEACPFDIIGTPRRGAVGAFERPL